MNPSGGPQRRSFTAVLRRALELARPCWPHLAGVTLLSLLSVPIVLLLPLPLMITVDSELMGHPLPAWISLVFGGIHPLHGLSRPLECCALLLLGIVLLHSLRSIAAWLLGTYTGEKLVYDLRGLLLFRCQRLSLSAYERRGASDVTGRIQDDAPAIRDIFLRELIPLFSSALRFLVLLAVMGWLCWPIAAVAMAISPLLWLLARHCSRRSEQHLQQLGLLDQSNALLLQETFRGLYAVKSFGQEASHDERFRRRSRQRMAEQLRLASLQAGHHLLLGCGLALASAAALIAGVTAVHHQSLTVGGLVLVLAYLALLYEPLHGITERLAGLEGCTLSLGRALALLDEAPETELSQPEPIPARVRGEVEFRNVQFRYNSTETPILRDISFHVSAGSLVGIVGASGSGKSTLVNLLTRFYDPCEGEILLDRTGLRHFSLSALRHQFAVIPQEPMLFSTTVAANIAYAAPQAPRSEVIHAAKLANADDFIRRLPQGYDTPIGQGGVALSAGERYRLAIARAFLKNAPVLVVDEPATTIDLCTEELIFESLDALMQGRTTFLIAHRLNTIERCEMVLVLQNGGLRAIANPGADGVESGASGNGLAVFEVPSSERESESRQDGEADSAVKDASHEEVEAANSGPDEENLPIPPPDPPRREPERISSGLFLVRSPRESREK